MDIGSPVEIVDVYGDGEPPKIRTIKYYLLALSIFLFIFIIGISYELYNRQATGLITITLPAGAELYYENTLLQPLKQPNHSTDLYSCRLPYDTHTFKVIDAAKKNYLLQFELKESGNRPRGFIFKDGTFIRF